MHVEQLQSLAALTPEFARQAATSADALSTFLAWAARTAVPDAGAPKVLLALARLVDAPWVTGAVQTELTGDEARTKIAIFEDLGFGIRERLAPVLELGVPFDEFARAVRLSPSLIAPFRAEHGEGTILLAAPSVDVDESPSIRIAESSLHPPARDTRPAPATTDAPPPRTEQSGIHTAPTVRRMVAIGPEALRNTGNRDD